MTRRECERVLALSMLSLSAAGAGESNLSGSWHLNLDKSSWGKKRKPHSVVVKIEHSEPALKYSGTVTLDIEGGGRPFEFQGAVDGKEYPYRDGTMQIRRINSNTTESIYRSADGSVTETARTTLSNDGQTLTRRIESKGPEGRLQWTELYDRH